MDWKNKLAATAIQNKYEISRSIAKGMKPVPVKPYPPHCRLFSGAPLGVELEYSKDIRNMTRTYTEYFKTKTWE